MFAQDAGSVSKLLVIRGGALGDFILTLPVLAALRQKFPRHQVEVFGYPAFASLAVAGGLADNVSALESQRFTGLFAPNGSWADDVSEWLAGFEIIISYSLDQGNVFQANVAKCSSALFIKGGHRPDEEQPLHACEFFLQPLRKIGICDADPCPRLTLPQKQTMGRRVAIHPGSGSERKNWPEASWAELLKILASQTNHEFLLIGGEAEGERCERLASVFPANRVCVAQSLPLVELAQRLQTCSAFIGHDSGITHLAAALDLPGLVLWGESNLEVWRPRSDKMNILREPDGLKMLSVAKVFEELKKYL